MMDAHTEAGFMVGQPFAHNGDYDFSQHGEDDSWCAAPALCVARG